MENLTLRWKLFVGVVKTALYVSIGTFWIKLHFFEKLVVFISFQDIEREDFGLLSKKFRCGLQNSILRIHRNFLMRKSFLLTEKCIVSSFSDIKQITWASYWKKIWLGCQNCIVPVHRNILKKNFFSKKIVLFIIFGHWAKHFWPFVENVSVGLSILHSTCSREILRKSVFLEKIVF